MEKSNHSPEQSAAKLPFDRLLEVDAYDLSPDEAVGLLASLEKPEESELFKQSFRLEDVVRSVSLTEDWRLIDRTMDELKRLGAVETDDSKVDPDFGGGLIRPKVLRDPEYPDSALVDRNGFAARTLDQLRERRKVLFDEQLDSFTRYEVDNRDRPWHLDQDQKAEAARRMIAENEGRQKIADEASLSGKSEQDYAHEKALAEDREARVQAKVHERYTKLIGETSDVMLKKQLEAQRDQEERTVKARIEKVNQNAAKLAGEVSMAVRDRHEIDRRIDRQTPELEDQAEANRAALGIKETMLPDWTQKAGGWHFSKDKRGPRVIEEGRVSPDNPYVIVVDRRLRSTGELLSQEIHTLRKAARLAVGSKADYSPRYLPPRSFFTVVEKNRRQDLHQNSAGLADYIAGWGDFLPGNIGKSYDNRKHRRTRSWILSWFGI